VDPVNNPEDRRWFRQRIDLSEWAAETVTLILVKEAPNDAELEYALWADPIRLSVGYTFPWLDDAAADNPTLSITRWLALPLYSITLDGDTRLAVRQHPVSRASVPLVLPDGDATLSFGLGLDPELWAGRIDESTLGDGVTFSVNLQSRGESVTVFEQYVDPKNNLDERRWQDFTVDLSRWSGQPAELIFSTDAGPVGDATYDWAFWSDITVSGSDINPVMAFVSDTRQFAQVYEDEDVSVFRNELVFPRAYVVRNVVVADDTADAVERFGDPDFNPANAVILTGPLDAETQARLDALPSNLLADTVDVTGERVNSMTLAADLSAPGVLVVSELDYPGWHAHVDGVETPILQANGVARALYLDAGQHTIEFYYHPLPFWGGVWVSVAALVLLAVVWWLWGRRGTVEQPALVEAPEPATA
jgi:hypothetical protein